MEIGNNINNYVILYILFAQPLTDKISYICPISYCYDLATYLVRTILINLSTNRFWRRKILNILNKKQINITAYLFIGIALICSLYLAVQRINIEKGNNQVEIIVNLTELESLANANNLEVNELSAKLRNNGVTGVLAKEISLGDLARTGQVEFFQGEEIQLAPYAHNISQDIPLSPANIIIAVHTEKFAQQIMDHLRMKLPGSSYYPGEVPALVVPVNIPNSDHEKEVIYENLKEIGVGFDYAKLGTIAKKGLKITPQIRDWPNPTTESLEFIVTEIKNIPELSFIMFNDENVPGYPDKLSFLAENLKNKQGEVYAPIGIVEFFNQKGIDTLATLLDKETVRVHSISLNEMKTYNQKRAIDRFELAVSERNIRALFVRFFKIDQPAAALETNINYLNDLQEALASSGYTLGSVEQFDSPIYSRILIGLIGLGVIAGGVLILNKKNWAALAVILGFLGIIAWGGLLLKSPLLARKLMALASVIIFPTLSFLTIIREKARGFWKSILALFKLSAVSLLGALLMIGLLADKLFMLKLDQFVGVKAAHVIPLMLIPVLLFLLEENLVETVKKFLDKCISYKVVLLAGIALIALGIYVIRTGNVGTSLVLGFEQQMRDALQNVLGVRPRTKEFLIGHPFTLFILYYGLSKKNWLLILPAIIGQVSLVNTYAHIHTPVVISMIRSFNGLWIGIIFGIGLIYGWKLLEKLVKKIERNSYTDGQL